MCTMRKPSQTKKCNRLKVNVCHDHSGPRGVLLLPLASYQAAASFEWLTGTPKEHMQHCPQANVYVSATTFSHQDCAMNNATKNYMIIHSYIFRCTCIISVQYTRVQSCAYGCKQLPKDFSSICEISQIPRAQQLHHLQPGRPRAF